VQYWMPFNGDYGLHDASWQTIPFGSAQYHSAGSHGCVHVPTDVMAWLYQWSAVDQTVVTIEG
jgi:lipoprotein-anchoring transpeptidase ErfK/SrfK